MRLGKARQLVPADNPLFEPALVGTRGFFRPAKQILRLHLKVKGVERCVCGHCLRLQSWG